MFRIGSCINCECVVVGCNLSIILELSGLYIVKEFCNVCMRDVVHIEFMHDIERRQQLVSLGYKIGKGSLQGCNCLIDSLLQLLLHHEVVKGPPCTKMSLTSWRIELCEMTRCHLRQHEKLHLRPRLRDEMYKEFFASEHEHGRDG